MPHRLLAPGIVVSCLTAVGCGPTATEREFAPPQQITLVEVEQTAVDVVDRVGSRGAPGFQNAGYRLGMCLSGTLARSTSKVDATLAITRAETGELMPQALTIRLRLESASLGDRDYTIATAEGDSDGIRVESKCDRVVVKLSNIYGTGPSSRKELPPGQHTIRVTIGLDGTDPVPLHEPLYLSVVPQ